MNSFENPQGDVGIFLVIFTKCSLELDKPITLTKRSSIVQSTFDSDNSAGSYYGKKLCIIVLFQVLSTVY